MSAGANFLLRSQHIKILARIRISISGGSSAMTWSWWFCISVCSFDRKIDYRPSHLDSFVVKWEKGSPLLDQYERAKLRCVVL